MRDYLNASTRQKARVLGISRSSLFYHPRMPEHDWALKVRLEETLRQHPSYGYRRLSLHLSINSKRVRRVMKRYGIKAYRRRGRRWKQPRKQKAAYPNLLMQRAPARKDEAWVADFTYLPWHSRVIYVATVMDVFTRQIVGISVLATHTTTLVLQALWHALLTNPPPALFHSDNGVEYNARVFREALAQFNIAVSRSKKGCPWENGYQESFYDKFKIELGDPTRFSSLGELIAEVYRLIHYYNTERIHSALRMPPRQFARLNAPATLATIVD